MRIGVKLADMHPAVCMDSILFKSMCAYPCMRTAPPWPACAYHYMRTAPPGLRVLILICGLPPLACLAIQIFRDGADSRISPKQPTNEKVAERKRIIEDFLKYFFFFDYLAGNI